MQRVAGLLDFLLVGCVILTGLAGVSHTADGRPSFVDGAEVVLEERALDGSTAGSALAACPVHVVSKEDAAKGRWYQR